MHMNNAGEKNQTTTWNRLNLNARKLTASGSSMLSGNHIIFLYSILCPTLLSDYFILFLYPQTLTFVLPFKDMSIAFLPFPPLSSFSLC